MFGLFKKGSDAEDDVAESENVTTHYEGGVMSADYVAETLDRYSFQIVCSFACRLG